MNFETVLDELEKLGAVSPDQARRSLDRLQVLEQNKPTAGQVGRYAALGAATTPAINMAANVIRKKPILDSKTMGGKVRQVAADATKGAVGLGALPLVRGHLDRQAEIGTLKRFMKEQPTEIGG